MTTKENMLTALNGGTPDTTPLSLYSWMMDDRNSDKWRRLLDAGLGVTEHSPTVKHIERGVEDTYEEKIEDGRKYTIYTKKTPVGSLQQVFIDGWHHEYFIKTPEDYKIMQWITEHTELIPAYDEYYKDEELAGDYGIAHPTGSRTPLMSINVDWAGTEQFCMDAALEVPELFDLFEARKKLFLEETRLIAQGPGQFIKWFENLTISMIGAKRYSDFLVSIYDECAPILEKSGKRAIVHYDGALKVIADQIAAAPFQIIESLTEPPEGDMTYDECRRVWPDKVFWGNINIECYFLSPEKLREEIIAKRNRAGKKGLLFEVSEDLPSNWETTIPIVLETLAGL
jgi:hypothetical protein